MEDDRPVQGVAWAYRPVVKTRRAHGLPLRKRSQVRLEAEGVDRWKERFYRIKRRARLGSVLDDVAPPPREDGIHGLHAVRRALDVY